MNKIFKYIRAGDPNKIIEFLEKNPLMVNIRDEKTGYTPLHAAVMQGQIDIVKILLEKDADIYSKDNNSNTPLHLSAYFIKDCKSAQEQEKFYQILELLLKKEVELRATDQSKPLLRKTESLPGITPLTIIEDNKAIYTKFCKIYRSIERQCPDRFSTPKRRPENPDNKKSSSSSVLSVLNSFFSSFKKSNSLLAEQTPLLTNQANQNKPLENKKLV